MRARHKTPATFGLWMVDVICCSLGCTILLWLINSQKYKASAAELDVKNSEVAKRNSELAKLTSDLALRDSDLEQLRQIAKALESTKKSQADEHSKIEKTLREKDVEQQKKIAELLATISKIDLDRATLLAQFGGLVGENKEITAKSKKEIEELVKALNALADSKKNAEALLAQRMKEMKELEENLALLGKKNKDLELVKADGKIKIDDLNKQAEDLLKKLLASEATIKDLAAKAKMLPTLQEELKDFKGLLADKETREKLMKADLAKRLDEITKASKDYETLLLAKLALEKQLKGVSKELLEALAYKEKATTAETRREELLKLLGKKDEELAQTLELLAKVKGDTARLKELLDRRFAGIALTGKRVVFVVDTSGSMDLLDENTPAANKWTTVCATVEQIMRSLPDLEKYQVVVFAETASFLQGKDGEWLDFDAKKSPEEVRLALQKIKPTGGTNLHKGFQAAFSLRARQLDTVYLISDGLPSDGDGLTAEQDRTIKDQPTRSLLLSRNLRARLKEDWNRPQVNLPRVRINSVGFFFESPDLGAFLWALAREHDGSFVGMSKP